MKLKLTSKKIRPHNLSSTSKTETLLSSVQIENFEQVENDDDSANETEGDAKQTTRSKKHLLSKAVGAISGHFKELAEHQEDYLFAFSSYTAAPVWLPSNCIRIRSMNHEA